MADSNYSSWDAFLPQGITLELLYTYGAAMLVFLATILVGKAMTEPHASREKIKELMERRAELRGEYVNTKRRKKSRRDGDEKNILFMQKVVKKLNLLQANKVKEITQLMVRAGYRSKNAAIKYAFAQGACGFGFMLFSLMFVTADTEDLQKTLISICIPFAAFLTGLYLPKIMVVNTRNKRYSAIRKGIPDALDLMMICTEAGLTLTAALDRVSKEIGMAYPELADEISLTSIEIGFLPERKKALENLAERIDMLEIRSLVNILIQTEKYGTPVSQALRVLSKEFREQRMLRAEEKAARLPPMMTVPMILFILPTLFIMVISPAIIKMLGLPT